MRVDRGYTPRTLNLIDVMVLERSCRLEEQLDAGRSGGLTWPDNRIDVPQPYDLPELQQSPERIGWHHLVMLEAVEPAFVAQPSASPHARCHGADRV
jgi:hypothetical protein